MAEAAGLNGGLGGTIFRIGGGHIFIGVELANDALVEAVLGLEACEAGDRRVRREAGDRGARLDRGSRPDLLRGEPVVCPNRALPGTRELGMELGLDASCCSGAGAAAHRWRTTKAVTATAASVRTSTSMVRRASTQLTKAARLESASGVAEAPRAREVQV